MNLRLLEAFYWTATLDSATRAAERLSLSQAAVSARLLALEAQLRVKLFDRSDRRLRLTAAGRRLLPHALQMLEAQCALRLELGLAERTAPVLRIGAIESVLHTWLPALLSDFGRVARVWS